MLSALIDVGVILFSCFTPSISVRLLLLIFVRYNITQRRRQLFTYEGNTAAENHGDDEGLEVLVLSQAIHKTARFPPNLAQFWLFQVLAERMTSTNLPKQKVGVNQAVCTLAHFEETVTFKFKHIYIRIYAFYELCILWVKDLIRKRYLNSWLYRYLTLITGHVDWKAYI